MKSSPIQFFSDCTGSCKLIKLKMSSLIELLFYVFSELRISVTMATVFNGVLDVTKVKPNQSILLV
jgi:hypothetical protein